MEVYKLCHPISVNYTDSVRGRNNIHLAIMIDILNYVIKHHISHLTEKTHLSIFLIEIVALR